MPSEAIHGFGYQINGDALLYKDCLVIEGEEVDGIECPFHDNGDLVSFSEGWHFFTAAAQIGEDSALLVKVEPFKEYFGLNFVEIIN